jgi:hypothetical protein
MGIPEIKSEAGTEGMVDWIAALIPRAIPTIKMGAIIPDEYMDTCDQILEISNA